MNKEPLDETPPMWYIQEAFKKYKEHNNLIVNRNLSWLDDKSIDFYYGMVAGMRLWQSSMMQAIREYPFFTIQNMQQMAIFFEGETLEKIIKRLP